MEEVASTKRVMHPAQCDEREEGGLKPPLQRRIGCRRIGDEGAHIQCKKQVTGLFFVVAGVVGACFVGVFGVV